MASEMDASEFANRVMGLVMQRAKVDPYTGRAVITISPEVIDAAMSDMGLCHTCGLQGCGCAKKRLADFTPEERAEVMEASMRKAGLGHGDTRPLVSPDGRLEIRFLENSDG